MRYVVTIGEQTLELDVEQSENGGYRVLGVGGPELQVQPLASRSGLISLLVDGQALEVQPAECEVRYRGERFAVRADNWLERAQRLAPGSNGARSKKLVASMPGRIVRVLCAPGNEVQEGAPLVVMEAMKMQNELCAKTSAVVRAVRVSVGQTVERGALLIEFE